MIGRKAEDVLNRAVRYAFDRRHEYFTLEHVFLSLLEDSTVGEIVRACGGDTTKMKQTLERYLDQEVPAITKSSADEEGEDDGAVEHPVATLGIQRLIQRALFHVQSAGKDE